MLKSIFIFLISFFILSLQAQELLPDMGPAMGQSGAEMKFEKEMHDFGKMKVGQNAVTSFKFKNTGKEPLIISKAEGSCDCTKAEAPKRPIMPGETAEIKVTYDTKKAGVIQKKVVITSNAWDKPTKEIYIKGSVD
jgi:hypothetical protein